jgi:hypothetical protein
MTRQERRLLNKSRQTTSWLVFLCILLGVWIKFKYDDVSYVKMNMESLSHELDDYQKLNKKLNLKLDSFNRASIVKVIDTPSIIKPIYKPKPVKIDTVIPKDSIKPGKKDILKDTLK